MEKYKREHFDGMNIDDLDEIISNMCLKLQLRVNFNVRVLSKWHSRYCITYNEMFKADYC